jgi:hypothetical protein
VREPVELHPERHLWVTTPRQLCSWLGPVNYEIRVEGVLDRCWSAWFDGLHLTSERDGVTVIAGTITDQAALHSVLIKIRDLGLPLISLRRVDPYPAEGGEGRGAPEAG